ncbi:MAG TPA: hypothetical protein VJ970_05815 [Flavobacteriaceae bacterium]|nr:hypothetical protein [Flavobacteriaceae bacterium]
MKEERGSDIHLRPRFQLEINESKKTVLAKFKAQQQLENCTYCIKVIGDHVVVDVPKDENHFWSPQLHLEIEETIENKALVKGLFGPKPTVWTLFMFIHFAVAVAFIGFGIMWYVTYTIKTDTTLAMAMVIVLPILWILLYIFGRLGRIRGRKQMRELNRFMTKTLAKTN